MNTAIFQAEIYAIDRCAQINLTRNYQNRRIAILTDSQAAIEALKSHQVTSNLVMECLDELNKLGEINHVWILWVPGHVGVGANELADKLAKKCATTLFVGPEPFFGLGKETTSILIREKEKAERELYWGNLPGLLHSELILTTYNQKRFEEFMNLMKNNLRIIPRILTGHCRLNYHLTKLGVVSNEKCRFCRVENETAKSC